MSASTLNVQILTFLPAAGMRRMTIKQVFLLSYQDIFIYLFLVG
jgi:hypothetical protein